MVEIHAVFFSVTPDGQFQGRGQGIDTGNADTVQSAGNLVRILVEFSSGMQFSHNDFGSASFRRILVVEFDSGRNAAAVVNDGDRIVRMQRDVNFRAVSCKSFINRIVQYFENKMVKSRAIRRIADVHARTLSYSLKSFQNLNGRFAIGIFVLLNFVLCVLRHGTVFLKTPTVAPSGKTARRG